MNGLIAAAVWDGLGGWLAWRVHLPGGAVVGAMLATALYNFTQPVRAVLPLALLGAVGFLLFGFGMAALAVCMGWLDAATAHFGFTPGGISVMSLVAAEEGGQAAVVATMHFVRVVTIPLAAP